MKINFATLITGLSSISKIILATYFEGSEIKSINKIIYILKKL